MPDSFQFPCWSSPEEARVSSAGLLRFLDAWEKIRDQVQFHSLILLRHGKTVCRMNFAPYDDVTPHALFSLSKSFTSAAAGFAVSEGKLRWDSSVTEVLPGEIPEGREEELRCVTVETLLSMGSGLEEASDSPSYDPGVTWARHVLSHKLVHPPMTHFHYNTFGTYLVSCMVQQAVGETVRDYLIPRLFSPLGIETPEWDKSPQGVCCGGFGLHLSADSIARFGQCLLQKGVWQGKQVLPEGWVDLATREHIANYEGRPQEGNEWAQGYGFQFWRCMDGRYRGDGAMGQACIVDEKRDAVLAVTCAAGDMGAEFRLIREHVFPAFDAPAGTEEERAALQSRIAALRYDFPADDGTGLPLPDGVFELVQRGERIRLSMRRALLDQIEVRLQLPGRPLIRLYLPRGKAGLSAMLPVDEKTAVRLFGAYGWQEGKLRVALRSPDSPLTLDGAFTWKEDALVFDGVGIGVPGGHLEYQRVKA